MLNQQALKTSLLPVFFLPVFVFTSVLGLASTVETRKLTADLPQALTYYGYDVAVDGNTLVVGAYNEDVQGLEAAGAVYVYRRHGGAAWAQEGYLTASDAMPGGLFGVSVAVHGKTLVVGAIGQGDNGQPYAGAAYVFTRQDGTWLQEAKLVAAEPESGDYLGQDVAVENDTALVGTFGNSQNDGALIFVRTEGGWTQRAKLVGDAPDGGHFGAHVALHGNFALVSAYEEDVNAVADTGAVYVYVRGADGQWWRHAKLAAPDAQPGQWFGGAVAIRDNVAVIGSPLWAYNHNTPGAAYVFTRNGSDWTLSAQLLPPSLEVFGLMGHAVAIGSGYIVVGAPAVEAAYLYQNNGLQQTLAASDGQIPDQFGYSVSASAFNIAVSAPQAASGGLTYAGATYLYRP